MVHLSIRIRSTFATLRLIQSYLSEKQRGAILGNMICRSKWKNLWKLRPSISGLLVGLEEETRIFYEVWRQIVLVNKERVRISVRLALQKIPFFRIKKKDKLVKLVSLLE